MESIFGSRSGKVLPVLLVAGLASMMLGAVLQLYPKQAFSIIVLAIGTTLFVIVHPSLYDATIWIFLLVYLFAGYHIPGIETARWLVLLLLLLLSAFVLRHRMPQATAVSLGLGVVALFAICTSALSYYPVISLFKAVSLLLLAVFLYFVPPAIGLLRPFVGVRDYLLRFFVWFGVAIVLTNVLYALLQPSASFLAGRYRGWFQNPNGIGAIYGVFLIPILAGQVQKHVSTPRKWALTGVALLALIELLASGSRAGIAAGLIALSTLILPKCRPAVRVLILSVVGLILLSLVLGIPENDRLQHLILRDEPQFSGSGRFVVWADMWQRFLARPILGSGLGVSETGLAVGALVINSAGYIVEKGNSYLALLDELGLVGTALVGALLVVPLLKASSNVLRCAALPGGRTTDLRLVAIVFAGLANALFEAWLLSVGSILCVWFWMFAALLLLQEREIAIACPYSNSSFGAATADGRRFGRPGEVSDEGHC